MSVAPTAEPSGPARPAQRESRVLWELHQAVSRRLAADAAPVMAVIPRNLARSRHQVTGSVAQQWLDEWEAAYRDGPQALIALCAAPGDHGDSLRQVSPFAGALPNAERLAAIRRAQGSP